MNCVDLPATDAALTCRLEATLAIDPDAWKKKGQLRVATSTMTAR